ncbi:hypothetical protein SAMN05216503_1322 [Polaribacter sp. KT25b]|uniref:hypothetical protein n=1 Tax=Polaribacter sp. KT25b TaxID=1855336 RepID=UPI00087D4AB8|nr:hypothetical protein [Polaribacter sp. KT25b]SDR89945.1 hypothetical protein SAMN05216503_1322 [Polaribacter sp. KT25b]
MKNLIKLFILMLFVAPQFLSAQSITNVKTLLIENEYGNARLKVTPNTYDMTATKPTKLSGVYGLLVCYTYKGVKKALHQDLTYDFAKKGEKELFLGMSATKANIVINSALFYRRDLTAKKDYPKKTDCF